MLSLLKNRDKSDTNCNVYIIIRILKKGDEF